MKNKKLPLLLFLPLVALLVLWLLSQAFHLISAPSDTKVLLGFLLLGGILAFLAYAILYLKNKKL